MQVYERKTKISGLESYQLFEGRENDGYFEKETV